MFDDPLWRTLIVPYGIAAFVFVILLLDWYGRRKARRSKHSSQL
jgi:hypothetical protein